MNCFMKNDFDISNLNEGSLFGDMIPNFDLHMFSFQQVIQPPNSKTKKPAAKMLDVEEILQVWQFTLPPLPITGSTFQIQW